MLLQLSLQASNVTTFAFCSTSEEESNRKIKQLMRPCGMTQRLGLTPSTYICHLCVSCCLEDTTCRSWIKDAPLGATGPAHWKAKI